MIRKLLILFALSSPVLAQTTTWTGIIKDVQGNVVTSGKVNFTLTQSVDATIPGQSRFVPSLVSCTINGDGTMGIGTGACVTTMNTAISPTGTSYKVCIQPYFAQPGSCFFGYAVTATQDISTQVPTPSTGPFNYNPLAQGLPGATGPTGPQGPPGTPTSGLNLTPSATQTVVPTNGAATNIGRLQMTSNFSYAGSIVYRAWGDSMTFGFGIPTPATQAYPVLVAGNNGWPTFENHGVSGDMCPDAATRLINTYTVAPGQINSLMIGFNDNYFFGASLDYRLDYYRHCQEALIAWMGTLPERKILSSSAAVTYTGSWTPNIPSQYGGLLYQTTSVGGTATFTTQPATTVDVVTLHQNTNTSDYTITIDGVPQFEPRSGTIYFSTSIDITTNNGISFAPYLHHFSGLPNTPHTVVLTSAHIVGTNPNYFLWAQSTSPGQNGTNAPTVYLGTVPRSTAAAYAASPVHITPTDVSSFNNAQYLNMQEMGASGVNVTMVDISNTACFDPNVSANVQSDGIHPTALGYTFIAACWEKEMSNTVVSRNWQPYYSSERSYKGGLYAGDPQFDATGNPIQRGQLGSSTFNTTGSINTGRLSMGSDGFGTFQRLPNDSTPLGTVWALLNPASGFDGIAFGQYATGFPYLFMDTSVAGVQTYNFGLFGKSRTGIHAKQAVFDTSVVAASVVRTAGIGPAATVLWTSGSGAPSGACVNGSMYTSTTGTTVNILWACGSTAWQLVK